MEGKVEDGVEEGANEEGEDDGDAGWDRFTDPATGDVYKVERTTGRVEWEVEEDEETIAGTRATRKKTKAAKTEKGLPSGHSGVAADDGSKTAKKKKWDTKVSNAFYK